jgi:hypothetical protein
MSKRWATPVVLTAAVVVGSISVAEAKASSIPITLSVKHKVNATTRSAEISRSGTPPSPGSSTFQAGTLTSSLGGGATIGKLTFAAPTGSGALFAFTGTNRFFTGQGSLTGSVKGSGGLQSNGSIKFTGTEKVTGGTGRYAGAKGKLTFTGVRTSLTATLTTVTFKGTITY